MQDKWFASRNVNCYTVNKNGVELNHEANSFVITVFIKQGKAKLGLFTYHF